MFRKPDLWATGVYKQKLGMYLVLRKDDWGGKGEPNNKSSDVKSCCKENDD